jgi:hypothetical protein
MIFFKIFFKYISAQSEYFMKSDPQYFAAYLNGSVLRKLLYIVVISPAPNLPSSNLGYTKIYIVHRVISTFTH